MVVPLVNGGTLCNTLAIGERPQPPHQGGAVKGSHRNKKPAPGAWPRAGCGIGDGLIRYTLGGEMKIGLRTSRVR